MGEWKRYFQLKCEGFRMISVKGIILILRLFGFYFCCMLLDNITVFDLFSALCAKLFQSGGKCLK